jgi:hypothetical protein
MACLLAAVLFSIWGFEFLVFPIIVYGTLYHGWGQPYLTA